MAETPTLAARWRPWWECRRFQPLSTGPKIPALSPCLVTAASPVSYAGANYPPALFLHGTSDDRVDHSTTMVMYQKLENAGVPVDLHLFAGQDHFFDREPHFAQAVIDAMALFIRRYVPVPVKEAVAAS